MGFIQDAVNLNDKLKRGQVWCTVCGRTENVDSVICIAAGWPKCCGYTMSLDEPKKISP